MAVFQDPPLVVDGIDGADQPARLVDATVAIGPDELRELARTTTVVLAGPLADAVATAGLAPDLGPAVVVEVEVVRGTTVDPAPFDDLAAMGLAAGAHLVDAPGAEAIDPADAADADARAEADGWELGAVTWLLANGVRTIRGVDAKRLRRLVAVAEALDRAAAS